MQADTVTDLEQYSGQLEGAVVLMADPPDVEPVFEPRPRRTSLDSLLAPPAEREVTDDQRARREEWRRRRRLQREVKEAIAAEGVAVILTPSSRNFGMIRGGGNNAGREADNPDPTPELVVIREQYNQIYRNVEAGIPVRLEIEVQNEFFDDDLMEYNTLGDIPGTDLADEYVMLGAHLDSWHYGGGATDNGAGSVVMMEAVRILKTLNLQPRRTIRIALWSGEEQGLLGSRNWVENHQDLHDRISAYVNVDNGTGKVRGIWDQMNEQAIPIFEQLLWPFHDLGVVAVKHGNTGGTDHLAFDRAGIPGFNFIQDPIEYGVRTHHTYIDTYDNAPYVHRHVRQPDAGRSEAGCSGGRRDGIPPRHAGRDGPAEGAARGDQLGTVGGRSGFHRQMREVTKARGIPPRASRVKLVSLEPRHGLNIPSCGPSRENVTILVMIKGQPDEALPGCHARGHGPAVPEEGT